MQRARAHAAGREVGSADLLHREHACSPARLVSEAASCRLWLCLSKLRLQASLHMLCRRTLASAKQVNSSLSMPEALPGDPDRHAQGGRHREQRVGPFERGFFFPCRWQLVGKTITTRSGSASRGTLDARTKLVTRDTYIRNLHLHLHALQRQQHINGVKVRCEYMLF